MVTGFVLQRYNFPTEIFILLLITLFFVLVAVIIVFDIKTWLKIQQLQTEVFTLGNLSTDPSSNCYNAEQKRLQMESRFAKVVILLLVNLVVFILPQVVIVGMRQANNWCNLCVRKVLPEANLFHSYIFPLFYISTPILYVTLIPKYRKSLTALFTCCHTVRQFTVQR